MKNLILLGIIFSLSISETIPLQTNRQALSSNGSGTLKRNLTSPQAKCYDDEEFLINRNVTYFGAPNDQRNPSVAFDGTNFFVVWQDSRRTGYPVYWDIYGARVDQDGILIDAGGIPISTAYMDQYSPSIIYDGLNYFTVWQDSRNGSSHIYGARISPSGQVLDTMGIQIFSNSNAQSGLSLAYDGTNYLVVWQERRNSAFYDIYGARVTTSGVLIDTTGIPISTALNDQIAPSVTFDGTDYFVVWQDYRSGSESDIYGTKVTPAGIVLDTAGILISAAINDQCAPAIAFDDYNYLVVWHDYRLNINASYIFGARVNRTGAVIDTQGIRISSGGYTVSPVVAFDGTNYLVAWDDVWLPGVVSCARLTRSGFVLDPGGILIPVNCDGPAIAFGGNNYFLAFITGGSSGDICGTRIMPNGSVSDTIPILISSIANSQTRPAISFSGTNYLVAWQEDRNSWYIYVARVNPSGIILDTESLSITPEPHSMNPSVIFGYPYYFVVYSQNGWIQGKRIDQNRVVQPIRSVMTPNDMGDYPSVAFDGVNYFVVWDDLRNTHPPYEYREDIYGARVNQDGIVLDSNNIFIYRGEEIRYRYPSVAFDGTNYFVVWQNSADNIDGARVNQAGVLLDTNGIAISTAVGIQGYPRLAFDGINYFVVWHDMRNGSDYDIYGARVSPAGIVLDPNGIAITTAPNDQNYPSVDFDGENYLVVWGDYRNGSSDIYGAKVSPSSVVIDSFVISEQTGDQTFPALAKGLGNTFITYAGFTDSINGNLVKTTHIWGKFYPHIGIAEENSKVKIQSAKLLEVYPNPAGSFLAVRLPQTADRQMLKIFDVSGKLVKVADEVTSPKSHNQEVRISLKGINPGIYFLQVGKEVKKFLVVK